MLSILFLNANKYRHNISNSYALNSHSIFWHHAFSHLTVTRSTTSVMGWGAGRRLETFSMWKILLIETCILWGNEEKWDSFKSGRDRVGFLFWKGHVDHQGGRMDYRKETPLETESSIWGLLQGCNAIYRWPEPGRRCWRWQREA